MRLEERVEAFATLGEIIRDSLEGNSSWHYNFAGEIDKQQKINSWFTPPNVRMALSAIGNNLTYNKLIEWTSAYPGLELTSDPARVALIMAGNIPLVGFHDLLSVLISGNIAIIRKSSKDPHLVPFLTEILISINPEFRNYLHYAGDRIQDFDMVIATGSDNTSRYFEYYFGKYPNIIRRNRSSIAILDGSESDDDIINLGTDIFSYFGLGCRNVSKLYLPAGYDPGILAGKWEVWQDLIHHTKYANNYDFNKAVYLVNRKKFIDTGFLLITEDHALSSPVGVLHIEYYFDKKTYENHINTNKHKIQCISSKNHIRFGMTQYPELWDYADGIDTLDFILKKKLPGIL